MKKTTTPLILCFLAVILAFPAACARSPFAHKPPAPAATKRPESLQETSVQPTPAPVAVPFFHRVNEGETLSEIASWYTGKQVNWQRLAQANPTIEPQHIFIGEQILIPDELLIQREPMPRRLPPAPGKKKTLPQTNAENVKSKTPSPTREVELFGPIESPSQQNEVTDEPLELETLD